MVNSHVLQYICVILWCYCWGESVHREKGNVNLLIIPDRSRPSLDTDLFLQQLLVIDIKRTRNFNKCSEKFWLVYESCCYC